MAANILVVDDVETNVKLLEAKLLDEFYIVYTARSGYEAIEVLKNNKIDVVLLDCRIIKASPNSMHIPVVIITALTDIEDKIKGLEAGADEFLTKPVNDTALFTRLTSLTNMKSVLDELRLRDETNTQLGIPPTKIKYNIANSRILVVNDDEVQGENFERSLSRITKHIKIATDQKDMMEIAMEFEPNAIIISCQMENVHPARLVVALKNNKKTIHSTIIMSSEEPNMDIVLKSMDKGASDYILLPLDPNELLARIKTQLQRKYYADSLRENIDTGINLAITDPLSGLHNRRYFETHLPNLMKEAKSQQKSLYAMMLDIDHFKSINSEYGFQTGDAAIKAVACALKATIPITDLTARIGGEEFFVTLCNADKNIEQIAENVRKSIESCCTSKGKLPKGLSVTASIGVTKMVKEDSMESLIERADKALLRAKKIGKNIVVMM
jgi:two-component system cell cycle response regulator